MFSYLATKLRGAEKNPQLTQNTSAKAIEVQRKKFQQDFVNSSRKRACDPETCKDFHCIWCAKDSDDSFNNANATVETSKNSNSEAEISKVAALEDKKKEEALEKPKDGKIGMKMADSNDFAIMKEAFNAPEGHKQLPNTRCYYCLRTNHEFLNCSQALVDVKQGKVGSLCIICGKMKVRKENCCDKKDLDKIRPDARVDLKSSQGPRPNRHPRNQQRQENSTKNEDDKTRFGAERRKERSPKNENSGKQKSIAEYKKERLPYICRNQATQTGSNEKATTLLEGEVPWDETSETATEKIMYPSKKSKERETSAMLPTSFLSEENCNDIKNIIQALEAYFPEGTNITGLKIQLPWCVEASNFSLNGVKK